jgi:hypothetical protein
LWRFGSRFQSEQMELSLRLVLMHQFMNRLELRETRLMTQSTSLMLCDWVKFEKCIDAVRRGLGWCHDPTGQYYFSLLFDYAKFNFLFNIIDYVVRFKKTTQFVLNYMSFWLY